MSRCVAGYNGAIVVAEFLNAEKERSGARQWGIEAQNTYNTEVNVMVTYVVEKGGEGGCLFFLQ